MMAEVLGISTQALNRWVKRRENPPAEPAVRGRPPVIPSEARWKIRKCYTDHYRTWGPRTLANWCSQSERLRAAMKRIAR